METLFSWTVPNEWNNVCYYEDNYGILKLFTYINEFEMLYGIAKEDQTNENFYLPKIIKIIKTKVKDIIEKIEFMWKDSKSQLDEFGNTS